MKKDNRPTKDDWIIILLSVISIFIIMSITFFTMPDINTKLSNTFNAQDYIWLDEISNKDYNKDLFDLSIGEFQLLIQENYHYNSYEDYSNGDGLNHNCQFWSYLYYEWFKSKGYEVKYVLSNSHLFVIAYVENGYWLLDGDVWFKVRLN